MLLSVLTLLQDTVHTSTDTRYDLITMPVDQFKWWIVLCFLAFHGVIAVIITELMSRSYGKWYIWLPITLGIPFFGPIMVYLWHLGMSTAASENRKNSFWERVLFDGSVNIGRFILRERQRDQDIQLLDFKQFERRVLYSKDEALENLLDQEKFGEARAQAWRMMEIAKDMRDSRKMAQYRDYLEIIAEKESLAAGIEF